MKIELERLVNAKELTPSEGKRVEKKLDKTPHATETRTVTEDEIKRIVDKISPNINKNVTDRLDALTYQLISVVNHVRGIGSYLFYKRMNKQ